MDAKDVELLEKNGWEIECESPFEISKDGSFATNQAANIVLAHLREEEDLDESIEGKIIKAKQRLYELMFQRSDWAAMHDIVYDLTNESLMQEGLESIFDQLPDLIQFDAFKWGLSDTEVSGQIHKYLQDNEISFK